MRALPYAALVLLLLAPASGADIWQWTDTEGVVRYTPDPSRVPSGSRGSLVKVEPGMPPPLAGKPAAELAPAVSANEVDADPFNAPQAARSVEVTEVPEPAWAKPSPAEPEPDAVAAAATTAASAAITQATPTPEPPVQTSPPPVSSPPVQASPPPVSSPPMSAPTEVAAAPPPVEPPTAPEQAASAPTISEPGDTAAGAGTTAVEAPIAVAAAPTSVAAASTAGVDPWSAVASAGAAAVPEPPAPPPPAPLTPEQRSRRDELEELISQDEETLKRLLSDTDLDAVAFEESAELREIAKRLPVLQAELRALEDGRAAPEAVEEP